MYAYRKHFCKLIAPEYIYLTITVLQGGLIDR